MTNPFHIKKSYKTPLTVTQINILLSNKLTETTLLGIKKYSGNCTNNNFSLVVNKTGGWPVKIKATMQQTENGSAINILYKPFYNPLLFLISILIFLLYSLFASHITLKGVFYGFLFICIVMAVFTWLTLILAYNPTNNQRLELEKELQLISNE